MRFFGRFFRARRSFWVTKRSFGRQSEANRKPNGCSESVDRTAPLDRPRNRLAPELRIAQLGQRKRAEEDGRVEEVARE